MPFLRFPSALLLALALALSLGCKSSGSSSGKRSDTVVPQVPSEMSLPPADPRTAEISAVVSNLLENEHLRRRVIDDEVSRKAFERYVELLDPGKMFLLSGDVALLSRHADSMDDQLHDGNLILAGEGAAVYQRRLEVVQALVVELLANPLDLTNVETIETDAEKLQFASTEAELRERWRKQLELEVLSRIVRMEETAEALAKAKPGEALDAGVLRPEDLPTTPEGREAKARADLAKSYAARFARLAAAEPIEAVQTFVNAIASVYDPHTVYMPPASKENFDIEISGTLIGIGAVLTEDDHYIRVREIVPGGASWRQGELEAGDLILAVTQDQAEPIDVADMRIDKVVQMIRGKKNTKVTLTVQKADDSIEYITIVRDIVEVESAYARGAILTRPGGKPVGYIYLPSFYGSLRAQPGAPPQRSSADDVRALLDRFAKRGVEAVIMDVRGNGGGLLDDAQEMSGLFIKDGPIVMTRQPDGERDVLADEDPSISFGGDVVVLVDHFSASASEILAAALQDYGRAIVVGTGPTHGKGTVQAVVDLDRLRRKPNPGQPLGVFKITLQQFFRINGASTQWRGVQPDIVLPDPAAYLEWGERHLPNSIPWSETEPERFEPWNKAIAQRDQLIARSKERVATQEAFAKIDARSKLLQSRRGDTVLPLQRDAYLAQRDEDRAALENVSHDLSKGPTRFKVEVVEYSTSKPTAPRPGGKSSGPDATTRWKDALARDPWLEETLAVAGDMMAP